MEKLLGGIMDKAKEGMGEELIEKVIEEAIEKVTGKEIDAKDIVKKLVSWLKSKNLSTEDIIDCVKYITK